MSNFAARMCVAMTLMKCSLTCCNNPENQIRLVFQTTISIWQTVFMLTA